MSVSAPAVYLESESEASPKQDAGVIATFLTELIALREQRPVESLAAEVLDDQVLRHCDGLCFKSRLPGWVFPHTSQGLDFLSISEICTTCNSTSVVTKYGPREPFQPTVPAGGRSLSWCPT